MKRSPIIYFLFFCSGITALVYEIVWTRMLTLVFGHTVFSVSVVLAAFMAGLGFGSYLFGAAIDDLASPGKQSVGTGSPSTSPGIPALTPLLIYGWIEIALFVLCGLLSLLLANFSGFYAWIHLWLPDSIIVQNAVKAVLGFLLIFIPTTLMGATLPIISKYYVTDNARLGTQIGILYGINTLGAAVGCLLTGFLLISVLGVLQTVLLTACVNLFIGISALRVYQESGGGRIFRVQLPKLSLPSLSATPQQKLWMGVSFICGFTALAYEVVWTRLLVFSISSTVYSFSMMLAVFLLGIVLGSWLIIPVIADFTSAQHNHSDAASGGTTVRGSSGADSTYTNGALDQTPDDSTASVTLTTTTGGLVIFAASGFVSCGATGRRRVSRVKRSERRAPRTSSSC